MASLDPLSPHGKDRIRRGQAETLAEVGSPVKAGDGEASASSGQPINSTPS